MLKNFKAQTEYNNAWARYLGTLTGSIGVSTSRIAPLDAPVIPPRKSVACVVGAKSSKEASAEEEIKLASHLRTQALLKERDELQKRIGIDMKI